MTVAGPASSGGARVLWVMPPHIGSCVAAMPIALALRAKGHEVVALSGPGAERWLSTAGVPFRSQRRIAFADWTKRETSPWRLEQFRAGFIDAIPNQVDDVLDVLSAEPFDAVLADSTMSGSGLAAELAGVRWSSYITFFLDEARSVDEEHRAWWDDQRAVVGLGPDPRPATETFWVGVSSRLTMLLGLPELVPCPRSLPPYVHRIGPTVWDPPGSADPPDWVERLGRDRPAVLVSTSSAWLDDADLVTSTAEALAGEDVDVVATIVADHSLPHLPPNVRLTGYCPHGLLLPKVSAVVCSGGFGVTTRAVCAGVPLVLVPQGEETQRVALAAARAGVGIALNHRRYTTAGLRAALTRVVSDARYPAAGSALAQRARSYNAPQTAAALIEERCLDGT